MKRFLLWIISDQARFLHRFSTLLFSVETMVFQLIFPAGDPQQHVRRLPEKRQHVKGAFYQKEHPHPLHSGGFGHGPLPRYLVVIIPVPVKNYNRCGQLFRFLSILYKKLWADCQNFQIIPASGPCRRQRHRAGCRWCAAPRGWPRRSPPGPPAPAP